MPTTSALTGILSHGEGGKDTVEAAVQQAAYIMNDHANLINLAVDQRVAFPAFSPPDRLVMHVRHGGIIPL